jgi:hypothetical protein
MYPSHLPTDARTHETAIRIARRYRRVIQACLREEEWADADQECYRICREELAGYRPLSSGATEGKR